MRVGVRVDWMLLMVLNAGVGDPLINQLLASLPGALDAPFAPVARRQILS